MPEMHLKLPGFTYTACGLFTENKEGIQQFMKTVNTNYIHKNDRGKACFQHDMTYGKYKDLAKRTKSDRVLRDKSFESKLIENIMHMKVDCLQWFANFFIKDLNAVV